MQSKYPDLPSDYYVPKDPWFIRARLLKKGVFAPGEGPINSAHSSRVDLDELRRRGSPSASSSLTSDNEVAADNASHTGPASHPSTTAPLPNQSHGVWVFVDIQLYQLEPGNYMVDFKCDGYQNVVRENHEWRPISKRIKNKEKEITSPYPYLDIASDLIAQLAVVN